MRPLKLILFLGGGLLAGSLLWLQPAGAMGLGTIQVNSYLNQTLDVTIPLLAVEDGDLDSVQVSLGTAEDFARLGLERPMVLAALSFAVETSAGRPVVRVTSEDPIREPFLSFLVRLEWPQGQLLRQYTVLLDPPLSAPTTAPEPVRAEPLAPREPAPVQRTPDVEPAAEISTPSATGGQYGPVAAGETLWGIANTIRPRGVSINQMMLALLRTNPDAFFEQNVNALKRGAVLRIPSEDELGRTGAAEVLAQIRRQNALWQDYRMRQAGTAPAVVEGGEPPPRTPVAGDDVAEAARVELVPPAEPGESVDADTAVPGVEAATTEAEIRTLRDQLARTQEELLARRQQTGELDSRVIELEAQVADLQRLLELKNDELAALQGQAIADDTPELGAEAMPEAVEPALSTDDPDYDPFADQTPPSEFGEAEPVLADEADEPVPVTEPGQQVFPDTMAPGEESPLVAQGQADGQEESARQEPSPPAVTAGEPPPEREDWLDKLLSPLVVGIFVLALIGALVAIFLHRRRDEGLAYTGASTKERQAFGRENAADEPQAAAYGAGEPVRQAPPPAAAPDEFDEAAVRAALEETPGDTEMRLQLLKHYSSNGERDAFVAEAETLYAQLADPTDPAWQEARRMGEEIAPEHPLFGGEDDLHKTATGDLPAVNEEGASGTVTDEEAREAEPESRDAPEEAAPDWEYNLADLTDDASDSSLSDTLTDDTAIDDTQPAEALTGAEMSAGDADSFEPGSADDFSDETMLGDEDAATTKLELAEAYLEMGDHDGARAMLEEVLQDGNERQQEKARELIQRLH